MRRYLDPWLRRLGIEPKRFWLLIDLFRTLSQREELVGQNLGYNQSALWILTFLYGFLGAILGLLMASRAVPVSSYETAFAGLTAFVLGMLLMMETANTLVNPVEARMLVHQPINGATYTAAKLTHLGWIVILVGGGLNLIPAVCGLLLPDATWFFPLRHLAFVVAIGFALALGLCAVFGWMLRFIPAPRMKLAAQVLAGLAPLGLQFGVQLLTDWLPRAGLMLTPASKIGLAAAGVVAVVLGLRTLSADYLIRASRLVQGSTRKRRRASLRWGLGRWIGRIGGGPAAHAGYAMVAKMVRRDWQSIRQTAGLVPLAIMLGVFGLHLRESPFAGGITGALYLPHFVGVAIFMVCAVMINGSHPEGVWIFRLAPASAFPRFARGVLIWVLLAAVAPHLVLAPFALFYWPWPDAVLTVVFGAAIGSLYAALSIAVIDGVPYSTKPSPERMTWMVPVMLVGMLVIGASIAVEMVLFRSHLAVLAATVVVAGLAFWFARRNVESLAVAMRFSLERSSDPQGMFAASLTP